MKRQISKAIIIMASATVIIFSCKKENSQNQGTSKKSQDTELMTSPKQSDPFNLDIDLVGAENSDGTIKFRQDPDPEKIITLDVKIHHLQANHEYQLQRAVDQTIDGNCTGTAWLTLGLGLTPQSIFTNGGGNGKQELWRDVSVAPTGAVFDIHFRIIDAIDGSIVMTSGCYQYTVR